METTRPPGFPGNPPARMPRAPTPARSPPPRPLGSGDVAFRPTQDVGPRNQCISGLNHAAYELPVNASRPGSPQAHASLGSGWRPTLAGWDSIPTGFRIRFRRLRHVILSPLTGLFPAHALVHEPESSDNRPAPTTSRPDRKRGWPTEFGHAVQDVARDRRFGVLGHRMSSAKPVANDRLVSEEGVFHAGLGGDRRPPGGHFFDLSNERRGRDQAPPTRLTPFGAVLPREDLGPSALDIDSRADHGSHTRIPPACRKTSALRFAGLTACGAEATE